MKAGESRPSTIFKHLRVSARSPDWFDRDGVRQRHTLATGADARSSRHVFLGAAERSGPIPLRRLQVPPQTLFTTEGHLAPADDKPSRDFGRHHFHPAHRVASPLTAWPIVGPHLEQLKLVRETLELSPAERRDRPNR